MPDIISKKQSRFLKRKPRYWQSARVTKLSVRQSSGLRARPGIRTFAEQASTESVDRLLPSLRPFAWQSLSAACLQSEAPLAETGHLMRPSATEDGVARRDRLSPAFLAASLARVLRSSRVSPVLFSVGRIDRDFSSALPISLNKPGFSAAAGGAGAPVGGGAPDWVVVGSGDGGGAGCGAAVCGQPEVAAIIHTDAATAILARSRRGIARKGPDRSSIG